MSVSFDFPAVPVGTKIADNYRVVEIVNEGGMSNAYKVVDDILQQTWFMKEIRPIDEECEEATNELLTYRDVLIYEAIIMSKLQSHYFPRTVRLFADPRLNRLYWIMDWVEGQSLQTILNNNRNIPVVVVVDWGIQICKMMEYLHSGEVGEGDGKHPILYRDLKPSNIIRRDSGDLCLIDFGIAIELTSKDKKIENPMGTVGYAAPELYQKNSPCDLRSDIYAIGATLLHLLTGKWPGEENFEEWKKNAHTELDGIIIKAMQPDPNDRYQTATELRYALENIGKLEEEKSKDIDHNNKVKKVVKGSVISLAGFGLLAGVLLGFKKYHR